MSRTLLMVWSIVMLVIGILVVGSWWTAVVQPVWLSWVEIILGVIGLVVAYSETPTAA